MLTSRATSPFIAIRNNLLQNKASTRKFNSLFKSNPIATSPLPVTFNRFISNQRKMTSQTKSTVVETDNAPNAIGPYSQAIKTANGFVYTSGCIPLDPLTGEIVGGDSVEAQTHQSLLNLQAVLKAAGSSLESVVKTTVFIKNMDQFPQINEVYAKFFDTFLPARSCVEVARLPKDVLVEIEAIATVI